MIRLQVPGFGVLCTVARIGGWVEAKQDLDYFGFRLKFSRRSCGLGSVEGSSQAQATSGG